MKRFEVFATAGPSRNRRLVVVLQHETLNDLQSVVVAPLYPSSQLPPIDHLRPVVSVNDREYVVATDRLAAVPRQSIGKPVVSLADRACELTKSLDFLFSGF